MTLDLNYLKDFCQTSGNFVGIHYKTLHNISSFHSSTFFQHKILVFFFSSLVDLFSDFTSWLYSDLLANELFASFVILTQD